MRTRREAECNPGYGCLRCALPPDACEHSGQKIFPEERKMREQAEWSVLSIPHPGARKEKGHSSR